jgi:D-glycero-D-manno-heptose 1,7-bisphosphate phosphatase
LKIGQHGLRRAVFLDRDGVLNRAIMRNGEPCAPTTLAEFELLPGAAASLARLHGFQLIVVTNQSGVARRTLSVEDLFQMHARLRHELHVDHVYCCTHDELQGCACRKPKPGLLRTAAHRLDLSLADSFMVGDRWQDIEAGYLAWCTTVFIDFGYALPRPKADATVRSLSEAVDWILSQTGDK